MKLSERSFAGISRRGKKIAFPDPGVEIISYRPYGGGFQGVDTETPITHLLAEGKVRGIILDPNGLNPEAIVEKLARIDACIRARSWKGIEWHHWLVLLTEILQPGELFHPIATAQAILDHQFHKLRLRIVPPGSTAMETGFLLHYIPQGTTNDELLKEYRSTLDEMARAFEEGDLRYHQRLERWANRLVDTREERLGIRQRTCGVEATDLITMGKMMRVSQ